MSPRNRLERIPGASGGWPARPLDEITSALDPELVGEVLELVGELAASGRIIESGDAEQVLTTPQHERTQRFLRRVTGGA